MSDIGRPEPETPVHASGVVTRSSPWSVDDTVARLSAVLAAREVKVFAVIDQAAEAEAVGLHLRETRLVIFGNPKGGTPVMQAAPLAALDLPLKVVVWQHGNETKISYVEPAELVRRYELSEELAAPLGVLRPLVDAVINR